MSLYRPPLCSEREPGGYEDCTWASAVMLNNAHHGWADVPSTRAEYEALRVAGGDGPREKPGDGSNQAQAELGIQRRYGWDPVRFGVPGIQRDFDYLWARLGPGVGASVQGFMGAFPAGHNLRRHDPGFRGAHCVYVQREDLQERVWWMDPLAPSTYGGEWVSKLTLRRYVAQLAGGYLIALIGKPAHVHLDRGAVRSTPFPDRTRAIEDGVRVHSTVNKGGANVVGTLKEGELFVAYQYDTGDEYMGSKKWLGDHHGRRWVHSKRLRHVGGST